jgi:hypothetical protein
MGAFSRLEVEIVQQFISRSNAANQGLYRDVCVKIVTEVPKGVIPALGLGQPQISLRLAFL